MPKRKRNDLPAVVSPSPPPLAEAFERAQEIALATLVDRLPAILEALYRQAVSGDVAAIRLALEAVGLVRRGVNLAIQNVQGTITIPPEEREQLIRDLEEWKQKRGEQGEEWEVV